MVEIVRSTPKRFRGKLCHFTKEDFKRHELLDYYWKEKDNINIQELLEKLTTIMQEEGFVFFNTVDYKLKYKFGCLHEVAIQYHHIL